MADKGPKPDSRATEKSRGGPIWSFDPTEKILFATHPEPVELATREQIAAYFDNGIAFWRQRCNGEKIYIVVDYDNLTTNLEHLDFYATQVKRVIEQCAVTVIRYSGGMLQRMAGRMTAIKLHTPSNTYGSREEAIAVVRGLRRGTIQTAAR